MGSIEKIAKKLMEQDGIDLFFSESLAPRTSFKIGGPAALLIEPHCANALCFAMNEIRKEKIAFFVLGGGTNVVFRDEGFFGIVVSTKKLCLAPKILNNAADAECVGGGINSSLACNLQAAIHCGAGVSMNSVVQFAAENLLEGLEEFAGLPGSAGGAVYMNARCFEKEISQVAKKISFVEFDAEKKSFVQKEKIFSANEWAYKKSPFSETQKIITDVQFFLPQKSTQENALQKKERLLERGRYFALQRKQKGHFEFPCAGSVFKNNRAFGAPTGKLLEGLGLKGEKIGGAQIAPFHANIIVNTGGASAADVRALADLAKREAKERLGIFLEEEIIFA